MYVRCPFEFGSVCMPRPHVARLKLLELLLCTEFVGLYSTGSAEEYLVGLLLREANHEGDMKRS